MIAHRLPQTDGGIIGLMTICPASTDTRTQKRTDMYLSTLRSHIEAMGGELEVIARFPDGAVRISNFSDLEKNAAA